MSDVLLWGTKNPAVVLTDEAFELKKMYRVKFTDGGIDSTFSMSLGDAETGGMYIYIVCKTFLANESIKITYTGIDDGSYTVPPSGGYSLSGRRRGDIVRVVNEIALSDPENFVKVKSVDNVELVSGGVAEQELEIWGIDVDKPLLGLDLPVPYHPKFEKSEKRVTLVGGVIDSKLVGYRLIATLAYQWIENEDVKKFLQIFNYGKHFYFLPHFEEAPNNRYKVLWDNGWEFEFWNNLKIRWQNARIIFRGAELMAKLPKAIEDVLDHTGFWSAEHARVDNDDARFWDGEDPYIKGDLVWSEKKAFTMKYTGAGVKCELYISQTHLATYVDDVRDLYYKFSNPSYNTIGEVRTVIDALGDYDCPLSPDETDFDETTENHYDATQPSSKLIPVNAVDIKDTFYQVFW